MDWNTPIEHQQILIDLTLKGFPIISVIGVQKFRPINPNDILTLVQDVYGFESNHKPNSVNKMVAFYHSLN